MRYGCPNSQCQFHLKKDQLAKDGSYYRKSDSRKIQRFKCKACSKRFSNASFSLAKNQNKRRANEPLRKLLCSGVSMRRAAMILNIHRTTVRRKVLHLSIKAQDNHSKKLQRLKKVQHMQFDDLITSEHTKLKPLSVSIAVNADNRMILGTAVSQIPAFGHLAKLSVQKYGRRKSFHKEGLVQLFTTFKEKVAPGCLVQTDEHKLYPDALKTFFPTARHEAFKGGRGCVAGQGELKKLHYDPLFALNHTCAMLRANINRLIRRTWCTTKDPKMLAAHIWIYVDFHNSKLLSG